MTAIALRGRTIVSRIAGVARHDCADARIDSSLEADQLVLFQRALGRVQTPLTLGNVGLEAVLSGAVAREVLGGENNGCLLYTSRAFMAAAFDNAEWATRDPMVLRGTTVTGDNYWKGEHDHMNALLMNETYGCPDPYALTEMEDNALAVVLDRLGMLDRYIIIRDSVNTDAFMNGASPESLWDPNFVDSLASDESVESADIFATAMRCV